MVRTWVRFPSPPPISFLGKLYVALHFFQIKHFGFLLDELIERSTIVIDLPKGSAHPRYPDFVYAVDYGYLQGTTSHDGNEIDIWVGSARSKKLVAALCTVDLIKNDCELKLVYGCTPKEIKLIHRQCNAVMKAMVFLRPEVKNS